MVVCGLYKKTPHSIASCCWWPRAAVRHPRRPPPSRSAAASSSPPCAASRPTTTATSTPVPRPISMAVLTQARLVRLNRVTDALEPALAERWESAADARTHTLHLRKGITFSDGAPFTAADVLFSFAVAYDAAGSRLGDSHHRSRPAAPGHLPRSVDRGHSSARGVRAGPPHPRQPADPAAPQARRRLPQRHDPEGLGAIDTVVRDGRGLAPSC